MRVFFGLALIVSGLCLLISILLAWIDDFEVKKVIKIFLTLEIPALIIVTGIILTRGTLGS